MMKIDREFLETKIQAVQESEVAGDTAAYHVFGRDCANTYIPTLLDDIDILRGVKRPDGAPDFDAKTCESCYWRHQSARLGCGFCTDFSEFVELFSPEATLRHKELVEKARVKD